MFLILFVIFLCLLCILSISKLNKEDPPLYPGFVPIVGHAYLLFGKNKHFWRLVQKATKIFSRNNGGVLFFGLNKLYVITDPEDGVTAASQCLRKHYIHKLFRPWVGEGLFSTYRLSIWKRHRRLFNPAFNQLVLDEFVPMFNSEARQLLQELDPKVGGELFQCKRILEQWSIDSLCKTVLGFQDYTDLFDKKMYLIALNRLSKIVSGRSQVFWKHIDFLFNLSKDRVILDNNVKYVNDVCDNILKRKQKYLENNNTSKADIKKNSEIYSSKCKPFLDMAVDYLMDGTLSKQEIHDEVNSILIAGTHTTACVLGLTLVYIGSYTDVQEKVYQEICTVLDNSSRDVKKHDLPKLVYMEAVIKEVIRLNPIIQIIVRHVDQDTKLKYFTMKAGSDFMLGTQATLRHPVWGDDAHEFRPERWLDPKALADPNSPVHKNLLFGAGKRVCIGKHFALMSMKTALCHLVRRHRLAADVAKLQFTLSVILQPRAGDVIALEPR